MPHPGYALVHSPRPSHINGAQLDYSEEDIAWVASNFQVSGPATVAPFEGRGNINLHTYEIVAGGRPYLMQKVNSDVFTMPYRVMNTMLASLDCQHRGVKLLGDECEWQPIELVPTRDGKDFLDLTDEHGWSVWRMMVRITGVSCYRSLSEVPDRQGQLRLAYEMGRGLAIYTDLTSEIDPREIETSLPGYRDTGLYYRQLHSILAGNRTLSDVASLLPDDPLLRTATGPLFLNGLDEEEALSRLTDPEVAGMVDFVLEQESSALTLWSALAQGRIRNTVIHGDTKLENFLFCSETGRVRSLVDLDTIMAFTWLADWGDMLRSLVNVAGETERDLQKVDVDMDVYRAAEQGFLSEARGVTEQEVALMGASVKAIALELGVRFLTDYLRGDTYFQLRHDEPVDLNKVRARVQLELCQKLMAMSDLGQTPRHAFTM